jgi:hypothetical protein
MVSDDHGRNGLSAVLLTALLGCGCLQTQTGQGLFKTTAVGIHSAAPDDGAVVLAVAKPARAGAEAASGQAAEQGPSLNPVQPAGATDASAEQAPPPRPMPDALGQPQPAQTPAGQPPAAQTPPGQTPPAAGQPAKDATSAPPPANGTAPAPRPLPRNGVDPTLARKPYPAGNAVAQAGGTPNDPHQRPVPTATGALLNLAPGESPAERALELNARLAVADADRQVLEQRAQELTAALELRDRALSQHSRDIHEAAEEVARAREQVTAWRKELEEARGRLRTREQDDVQTLKAIIALLERLTEAERNARHDAGAARMPEE